MNPLMKWPFQHDVLPNIKTFWQDFGLDSQDFLNRMMNTGTTIPAANIKETDQAYEIELAVPGISKEDLKIQLDQRKLTVSHEQKSDKTEKDKNFTRQEYSFSSFKRVFSLPEDANQDAIAASYENGVLHLTLPRVEAKTQTQGRQIEIA